MVERALPKGPNLSNQTKAKPFLRMKNQSLTFEGCVRLPLVGGGAGFVN